MDVGALDATYVRDTYLRGIDLGSQWNSGGGRQAMNRLIQTQEAIAERRLGVTLCRRRVLTYPDTGLTEGTDYEIAGVPVAYEPLASGVTTYALTLPFPHVQSVQRVRLFEGYTSGPSPSPLFETVPLEQTSLSAIDGKLRFANMLITDPDLGQTWAVDYTIGLGQIPQEVAEWIALGVAIQVLSIAGAGQDMGAGLAGWSLDQDGIVERTEIARGDYGPYSGVIRVLQALRDDIDITRFRVHYQGVRLP